MAPLANPERERELDGGTLASAQRGEEGACRDLVTRYERPVFAVLSRLLPGRRPLVEDLAQETFLRVFRELARFDPGGPARLSTWILTIATRLGIDELRRRGRAAAPLDLAALVAAPDAADGPVRRQALGAAIRRAVEALPPEFRAAFVLREHHGLDYQEIAQVLAVDVGTVKSRLFRARTALREALAAHRGESP